VSDIGRFAYCQRMFYLKAVLGLEPKPSEWIKRQRVADALRREIIFRQPRVLAKVKDSGDFTAALFDEINSLAANLPKKYDGIFGWNCAEYVDSAKSDVMPEVSMWIGEMSAMVDDIGIDDSIRMVSYVLAEHLMSSYELNLCGRVDKVLDNAVPVKIISGAVPRTPWDGDCITLFAYGTMLQEEYNVDLKYGFLEYSRIWRRKPIMFTDELRAKLFEAIDGILHISGGAVPNVCPHGNPRKCAACDFSDSCYTI
jgi:CRISPR/Cas system-associated exonuclease Cas4 (RecB family)